MRREATDDRSLEHLAGFGIDPAQARAWIDEQTDDSEQDADTVEVWPENWAALDLFLRLQSQWRLSADGRRLRGLRYTEVRAVMSLLGLRKQRHLFEQLQDMERAVLEGQGDD